MSVRHQKRLYIEELFSHLKQTAGEYRIYNLYMPEDGDIEDLEIIDLQVDFSDPESVKKYLDRTTRETLEAEVKGTKTSGNGLGKGRKLYLFLKGRAL
jgi:hypothetical protein